MPLTNFSRDHSRRISISLILHLTDDILSYMDLLKCISKKGLALIKFVVIIKLPSCLLFEWSFAFVLDYTLSSGSYDCLVLHMEDVTH